MTIWTPTLDGRDGPLYQAIADAIASAVESGELAAGDRLPPHRNLAYDLGVTVGTVTRGYQEAERRGLVCGEVGRGTFIKGQSDQSQWPPPAVRYHEEIPGGIDLSINYPSCGQRSALFARSAAALSENSVAASLLGYQPAAGNARHRAAAARLLSYVGLPRDPERVIICSGAQHGMTVVFAGLCQPGDTIHTEQLTYPGINAVAGLLHLRVRGIAIDEEGMIPEALDEACSKGDVKALYCVPTFHNPTASVMSEQRREAIAEVARKHGLFIVEDDVYGFLHENHPRPLASLLPDQTFFISSSSKCMMPALRIGFIAPPDNYVDQVLAAVRTTTWMANPIAAEIMTRWVEDGTDIELIEWHRAECRDRLALAARWLDGFPYQSNPGSYHVWLPLPHPWTADDVVEKAQGQGLRLITAAPFMAGCELPPHALRICLGAPESRDDLEHGLHVLADILRRPALRQFDVV